jgi:hypothetical protein
MAALHQILARWQSLRQADNRLDDKRQAACAQLAELLNLVCATLPSQREDRGHSTAPGDTITLLDRYTRDVTAWYAANSWLFQEQAPAMLEHIRQYSSLLHTVVTLLTALADAEHVLGLISRLNVCAMKLELEMRAINRYIGGFAS